MTQVAYLCMRDPSNAFTLALYTSLLRIWPVVLHFLIFTPPHRPAPQSCPTPQAFTPRCQAALSHRLPILFGSLARYLRWRLLFVSPFQPRFGQHGIPPRSPARPALAPAPSIPMKVLPSVTHIPTLNVKRDFNAWIQSVDQTITSLGLYDHICDNDYGQDLDTLNPALPPVDPSFRSDIRPSYPPPALTRLSADTDRQAYAKWWEDDNRAQWVLTSKLGSHCALLPASGPLPLTRRLGRSTSVFVVHGLDNFTQAGALFHKLTSLTCNPNRVLEYVTAWREHVAQLVSARFLMQSRYLMFCFLAQLPSSLDAVTTIVLHNTWTCGWLWHPVSVWVVWCCWICRNYAQLPSQDSYWLFPSAQPTDAACPSFGYCLCSATWSLCLCNVCP